MAQSNLQSTMVLLIPLIFGFVFILVVVLAVFTMKRMIKGNTRNNNAPVLSSQAKVVAKRQKFRHGPQFNEEHILYEDYYTGHYVTFEVPGGSRMELNISGSEFGLLVEGDVGVVTFQGTRFISFERNFM